MWAVIYSLDIGFSTQMGLPSSIKQSLTDTMPPRNLQDREFDATSTDLPPERPITELTSSTMIIAKFHVATNMGAISDLVCSPHLLSYEELAAANSKLDIMLATLPESCKFRSMSESLLDPPSVVFQVSTFFHSQIYSHLLRLPKSTGAKIDERANMFLTIANQLLHALSESSDPGKLEVS